DMWVSKWFSVTIRTPGDMNSASTGFLKLQSWNSDTGTMQAELFTRSTGAWQSASLDLHVTGTPMRLLLSFDYAAEFQFAASIIARGNAASLQAATLRGVGISLTATSSGSRGSEGTITITGALVPDSAVPSEILH
ncbi:MAG TPA: hypothetical protein VE398_15260, partial [Acidobacteriota bacterium]|nr:hypothetical protein [Acidobacteriota bacterium]